MQARTDKRGMERKEKEQSSILFQVFLFLFFIVCSLFVQVIDSITLEVELTIN